MNADPNQETPMATIKIDYENNGEAFWAAVQDAGDGAPEELLTIGGQGVGGVGDEIEVTPERAAEIRAFCEELPGWNNGPEFAPHPLLIVE